MLMEMHRRLPADVFELLYVQLWILWYRRNLAVHQDRSYHISYWKQRIVAARDEFRFTSESRTQNQVMTPVGDQICLPPCGLMVKLNVDAAQREDGVSQVGACARDHNGNVLFSSVKRFDVCWHPPIAEALAIHFCLQCALEENFLHIQVKSNCYQVIS